MIIEALHISPLALDRDQHRQLKLNIPITDWRVSSKLNSIFVAAAEFGDVARDFPIVFVRAGKDDDGTDQIAPIAVLGLMANENLYEKDGAWRAQYMPAVLRAYPFCIGRIDADRFAICVDSAWPGTQTQTGIPLFKEDGQPSELLAEMQTFLENVETEVQRTKLVCQRLQKLDVMREMRFDATFADGRQHSLDGFLTIDDQKMQNLPDNVVGELHRDGLLGLVHAHWLSMGNMRRLVDWQSERPAPPAAVGTAGAVAANA